MAILINSLRKYIVRKNNAEGNSYEGLETDTYHKKTGGMRRAGAFAACGSVYGRAKGGGEGHDLGNHSATHPHMSRISSEEIAQELQKCHENVKKLTGVEMELFRPPFGEYDNHVIETAEQNGYYTIQWDVDSLDWKEQGAEVEIRQVLEHKHLGNGSIILFHNDAKYTPKVLDTILKGIKEKGFEIVPISQLIHRENFEMDHEGRQIPKGKDV